MPYKLVSMGKFPCKKNRVANKKACLFRCLQGLGAFRAGQHERRSLVIVTTLGFLIFWQWPKANKPDVNKIFQILFEVWSVVSFVKHRQCRWPCNILKKPKILTVWTKTTKRDPEHRIVHNLNSIPMNHQQLQKVLGKNYNGSKSSVFSREGRQKVDKKYWNSRIKKAHWKVRNFESLQDIFKL